MVGRARVLADAAHYKAWLPAEMWARLKSGLADAPELRLPADPAWRVVDHDKTSCTAPLPLSLLRCRPHQDGHRRRRAHCAEIAPSTDRICPETKDA
jgi:hypothetical protein